MIQEIALDMDIDKEDNLLSFFIGTKKVSAYNKKECILECNIDNTALAKIVTLINKSSASEYSIILHTDSDCSEIVTYPDYGALNILKKINKHTKSNNKKNSISSSLLIQKPSIYDEEWKYLHSTIKLETAQQSILKILLSSPAQIKGIYFLHFEMIKLIKNFYKSLPEKERSLTNNFFVRSKHNFTIKVTFQKNAFVRVQYYKIDRNSNNSKIIEAEKIYSNPPQEQQNANNFFFSPNPTKKKTRKNIQQYFVKLTKDNLPEIVASKECFEIYLQDIMHDIDSSPIKTAKLKKLNLLKKYKNFYWPPLIILLLIFALIFFNFYENRGHLSSRKKELYKEIDNTSFRNQELKNHLNGLKQTIEADQSAKHLKDSTLSTSEIINIINITIAPHIKIFSIDMKAYNTSLLVGFKKVGAKAPRDIIKEYIRKLRHALPNKQIYYSRDSIKDILCEEFCFILEITIKDKKTNDILPKQPK